MIVIALPLVLLLAIQGTGLAPVVVQAPDSPVRLDRAKILNVVPDEPAVLLYAATNLTDHQLEQFTVTLFIFDAQGQLKARQLAPGRRTLDARSTKFSSMVLDVGAIGATDILVVGVNQAQRADSEQWWRADLQSAAEAAAKRKIPLAAKTRPRGYFKPSFLPAASRSIASRMRLSRVSGRLAM